MTGDSLVSSLEGVGPARATLLARLGITTVAHLLNWVPRRYLDATKPTVIAELRLGEQVPLLATVDHVGVRRSQRGQLIVNAKLSDDTGSIEAMWFNQLYIATLLQRTKQAVFIGEPKRHYRTGKLFLAAPKIESQLTVIPIYSLTASLTSRFINQLLRRVLSRLVIDDYLTDAERATLDVVTRAQAYQSIHLPLTLEQVAAARRRLVFDELYAIQQQLALSRQQRQAHRSLTIPADIALLQQFVARLPFTLTDDQRQAIWVMAGELAAGAEPMHRLLNGDVGSGKTVVAAALALLTVKAGRRVAIMAPTEILALQHAQTVGALLEPFDVSVGLVTAERKELTAACLIGTHALIAKGVKLSNIGLVVIDEQHRFGVEQRERLVALAATKTRRPHLLSLTATPIPRSLALVLFGDLDISVLRERPAHRAAIVTTVVAPAQEGVVEVAPESKVQAAMAAAMASGEQVYVVCPLIEKIVDDTLVEDERQSVTAVYRRLAKEVFPDRCVAVLHGKHTSAQKSTILGKFAAGKIDILVATSVVEVGVDIPNATVMVIESAERFGIAALHQLRGRVGRSDQAAQCFLIVREGSEAALARCQRVASTTDGFALAQFDLQQRGPGELAGSVQKGINKLFTAELDFELIKAAQELARAHTRSTKSRLPAVEADG